MRLEVFEVSGEVQGWPELTTGKYKIQMVRILGFTFQRHIWEKCSGEWEEENWIPSYIRSPETWKKYENRATKVSIDIPDDFDFFKLKNGLTST